MRTKNTAQTKAFAKNFAKSLTQPTILALYGNLGAGKTTFIQGLGLGLGIKRRILSPTFVFQRSYELKNKPFKNFHHVDLYRLASLNSARSIGIEEILAEKDSLIAIEWPEVIEEILPKDTIRIRFKKISEDEREITIERA